MSVQAVTIVRAGVEHEFTIDGPGTWELCLRSGRGEDPGGIWPTDEVAAHLVETVFDANPLPESPGT